MIASYRERELGVLKCHHKWRQRIHSMNISVSFRLRVHQGDGHLCWALVVAIKW